MAALAFGACSPDNGDEHFLEEIGLPQRTFTVDYEAGVLEVPVIANGPSTISALEGGDWVKFKSYVFSEDGTVLAQYDNNTGFPRMARFLLSLDVNPTYAKDTLTIFQKGLETPVFSLPQASVVIFNGRGETSVPLESNIPEGHISVKSRILDGDVNWIKNVRFADGAVILETEDNAGTAKRTAAVSFSYDDGWGNVRTEDLRLTQLGSGNAMGTEISWSELRAMAAGEGTEIDEDYFISGYVVSRKESCNTAENPMTSTTTIDYSVDERSFCIESKDGNYGFLVRTLSAEDNILKENTLASISLEGCVIRRQADPDRYLIEGVAATDILTSEAVAESSVPDKRKHISELTDDDIYTRVTLLDVEYPVRKGSLTPCFERMTNADNNDSATKFATLLRDKEGSSLYIFTNTTCPYRRDGTRMGYGGGEVRGIIVHEKHRPFVDEDAEDEDECGNIGRYQIRHQSRSDFRLADDFHDGFSEMICEFRYAEGKDGRIQATYGTGSLNQTGPDNAAFAFGYTGLPYFDYSCLGPVGTNTKYYFGKNVGQENGFGIILEDGTDYGKDFNANSDGRGRTPRTEPCNLAWAAIRWWNQEAGAPYYWDLHFSTKDITTDKLSLQLSMLNEVQSAYAPRYWKVEWAEMDAYSDEGEWKPVGEFALPDLTPTNHTLLLSMSAAFKPMDFPLPLEMLGKESVHIRIGPRNNLASDLLGYANATIKDGHGGGAMNYCAVRYNK